MLLCPAELADGPFLPLAFPVRSGGWETAFSFTECGRK